MINISLLGVMGKYRMQKGHHEGNWATATQRYSDHIHKTTKYVQTSMDAVRIQPQKLCTPFVTLRYSDRAWNEWCIRASIWMLEWHGSNVCINESVTESGVPELVRMMAHALDCWMSAHALDCWMNEPEPKKFYRCNL